MAKQDDFIRTALRVPPDLHAKIHEAASAAGRTFNSEIVHRLEQSFEGKAIGLQVAGVGGPGKVTLIAEIRQRHVGELRKARQELADAKSAHSGLMVEMLHGEEPRSRSTLRDLLIAENERIRTLEREVARLEDSLHYSDPEPTEEEIEAYFRRHDDMLESENEFKPPI